MYIVKIPGQIDLKKYNFDAKNLDAFYGLPKSLSFCSRCTYSNQKPNSEKEYKHSLNTKKPTVYLDENMVCAACQVAETKKQINWEKREKELRELCNKYRRNDGSYDCLVPGSGGKDSFYAAHKLKYEYGMNPLTVTWAPHLYTTWGWENFQAWIHAGFDNYLFTPNGRVHRLLTRLALENLFHPFQPFILGQMYFPPRIALKLNIPLVFYGENPTEYGNNSKENNKPHKDPNYFCSADTTDFHISGMPIEELKIKFGLSDLDLDPYLPLNQDSLKNKELDVRYLGYYLPWHPQDCYYYAVEHGGFKAAPERTAGTYSKYSSIDDKIDDLHYYTTFIKFGIGRATYDSSQEVRNGEITREEALALVKRFDGEYSTRFEEDNFKYLSINKKEFPHAYQLFEQPEMTKSYFDKLTDKFRSPHLWTNINGNWKLRQTSWQKAEQPCLENTVTT